MTIASAIGVFVSFASLLDLEIHDTVLIAAAFCIYNRYVDGLATWAPRDLEAYRERASIVPRDGYLRIPQRVEASQTSQR